MSNCKKCDRCGEHYAKVFDNRKLGKLYDNGNTTKDEWDLCPDCWESFDSWIANDDSASKNDVSAESVDANDANAALAEGSTGAVFVDGSQAFPPKALEHVKDSREKLLEDANALAIDYWHRKRTWGEAGGLKREIIALLDRQAAIIRAECEQERRCPGYDPARHYCKYHAQDFELNDRTVSRLKRENSALARDLAECERMREGLRARLSEAIGKASEVAALGDL